MQLEKDRYTKLLKIIRSIQHKQKKFEKAMWEIVEDYIITNLWESDVLNTVKVFDENIYDWFVYHLYECNGKWDVTISDKHFTWDSDEWFISFLVDNY